MVSVPQWQQLGPHRYYIDGAFLHWEPHGAIAPEHGPPFLALLDQIGARRQPITLIIDQRQALPIGPVLRRQVLDYLREVRPDALVAFVGSPLVQRAVNQLLIAAARTLLGYDLRHANFGSVEEAQRHLGRAPKPAQAP